MRLLQQTIKVKAGDWAFWQMLERKEAWHRHSHFAVAGTRRAAPTSFRGRCSMMDVQCCELQDDEPEYSPEELKEMSQIEEWGSEAWEM